MRATLSNFNVFRLAILIPMVVCVSSRCAVAGFITYTSRSAFEAASTGVSQIDFEGFSVANVPSGSSLGEVSFSYSLGSVNLRVVNSILTTSGTKSLGTDDRDMLQDGDSLDLSFSPRTGVGLYIISRDALFDGDVRLTVSGTPASLVSAASQINLGAGGLAWFLGVQSNDGATFTSASLTTHGGGGAFYYNLDDIVSVVTVPEPNSLCLLAIAAGFAIRFRDRKIKLEM